MRGERQSYFVRVSVIFAIRVRIDKIASFFLGTSPLVFVNSTLLLHMLALTVWGNYCFMKVYDVIRRSSITDIYNHIISTINASISTEPIVQQTLHVLTQRIHLNPIYQTRQSHARINAL